MTVPLIAGKEVLTGADWPNAVAGDPAAVPVRTKYAAINNEAGRRRICI
jgi:hypothetical protein